jgi:uncharacterized protein (TIGR03086 family)
MLDLHPATAEIIRLLPGVHDDRLGDPTPCPAYPVAALLDHLMALSLAFTWGADKQDVPEDANESLVGEATAAHLRPDWRVVLPQRLEGLAAAWDRPSAWEGETTVGGATMPGAAMGVVALDEVVLHGWDLARATGQDDTIDPAELEQLWPMAQAIPEVMRTPGAFGPGIVVYGPVVEVPDDAPLQHRVLALLGRDPDFVPGKDRLTGG